MQRLLDLVHSAGLSLASMHPDRANHLFAAPDLRVTIREHAGASRVSVRDRHPAPAHLTVEGISGPALPWDARRVV
jgi:hypothetical protein